MFKNCSLSDSSDCSSDESWNALHCSNALRRVESTALDDFDPSFPAKFYDDKVRHRMAVRFKASETYHHHYPILRYDCFKVIPELQSEEVARDPSTREDVVNYHVELERVLASL